MQSSCEIAARCHAVVEAELVEALERTGGARIVAERLDTLPSADVELLALLAGGATVRDIGSRLGSSARTVQRRLAALHQAFGVTTNGEVVVAVGLR
jgi:DNA-binding NarL/FixJ family response regulator